MSRAVVTVVVGCVFTQLGTATSSANWAGSLDPTFGSGGVVVAQVVPGIANAASSVAVEANGDVLVGGSAGGGQSAATRGWVARFLAGGALDPSFGSGGYMTFSGLSSVTQVQSVAGGGVLALGGELVRLQADGAADSSFGVGGVAVLPPSFTAQRFAVEPNGLIALIGTAALSNGATASAVARLSINGQPDLTFGTDGLRVLPDITDRAGSPLALMTLGGLVVAPDGAIIITARGQETVTANDGYSYTEPYAVLERVTAAGALDLSFGEGGEAPIVGGAGASIGNYDPLLAPDGTILLAVVTWSGAGLMEDAAELVQVPADGRVLGPPGYPEIGSYAEGLLALPGGGYLTIGTEVASQARLNISRVEADGNFRALPGDLPVGTPGFEDPVTLPAGASDPDWLFAVTPDGKFVLAGITTAQNAQHAMFVERLFGISEAIVGLPRQTIRRTAGTLSLRLTCSPTQECSGRTTLHLPQARNLLAGSGTFAIPAAASAIVVLKLTARGRARLNRRHATRATLTLAPAHGPQRTATITIPGTR
jgi:uncharacterized delta-60 repeat protein